MNCFRTSSASRRRAAKSLMLKPKLMGSVKLSVAVYEKGGRREYVDKAERMLVLLASQNVVYISPPRG